MNAERRTQNAETLRAIAEALRYPATRPVPFGAGEGFFEEVARVEATGLEELYTLTFDLNPVATLEAGWHLWGEQYERGRFLADMRGLQDRLGIDAGTELPDHLTALLPTIAADPDNTELAGQCVTAIEKMLKPLDEQGNPYRHLLHAALDVLASYALPAATGDAA